MPELSYFDRVRVVRVGGLHYIEVFEKILANFEIFKAHNIIKQEASHN